MSILFHNAKILASPNEEILAGAVLVEDNRISYIGKESNNLSADRKVDCCGNLLMSGFCNAHSHSAMTLFRGIADDLPLDHWLNDLIFPLEKNLTPEDVYWGTMLQITEFLRGGITCFADMYFFPDSIYAAAKNAHMCLGLCCGESSLSKSNVVNEIEKNYNKYSTLSDRVRYFPGVHAEYTCDEKLLTDVADFAAEAGVKTYIHLSETLKEIGDCTVRHNGLTPPQYLHKLGFFENGGLAAHCVYVDKDDIELLKQSGVIPIINSASNLKLASGVAPVYSMLYKGLRPALGTDGVASNNAASMFREMYLYSCLQKETMKDASAVPAEAALSAATLDGYAALGFPGGELKEGNFADMILIDLSAPNMNPGSEYAKHLVFSGNVGNVLMTVCGGKVVYDRGVFSVGEDLRKIYSECEQRRMRLMQKAGLIA